MDTDLIDDPCAAVASIRAGIDALLCLPLERLDQAALLDVVRQVEVQARRLPALDQELIAEVDRRGVAVALHQRDTRTLLQSLLRISPDEASARVRDADLLGPRRTFAGQPAPAVFEASAEALRDGRISLRHARLITSTIERLPRAVREEHADTAETFLLDQASVVPPRQLALIARRLSDTLDPDGRLSEPADHRRRRYLQLRQRPDGSGTVEGDLTPDAYGALRAVLDPLARPMPATSASASGGASENDHAARDGTGKDSRTSEQRYHDALAAAAHRLLRSGDLPDSGGIPTTVLITMTLEQFHTKTGLARTATGALRPVPEILDKSADVALVPIAITPTGRVAAIGHQHRLATLSQRLALAARDHGCTAPGCTIPPQWCDTHHITGWKLTARTTLDDLTLACGYHHGLIDHGWTVQMINNTPHWTAPTWLDPTHTPRRNTAHAAITLAS